MKVLGISALYHDSAAAIVDEGGIIAAVQEERFTRIKHDSSLPFHSIDYCLNCAKVRMHELDAVIYYDNPLLTLDRAIHNAMAISADEDNYILEDVLPKVLDERIWIHERLRKRYGLLGINDELFVTEHHLSHAASAYYPSPFEQAAILTLDGVGEWATTTLGRGMGPQIEILKQIDYPHSLGLLYSAFTSYCGFKVNSGDYKFMGLAPYGQPVYYDIIRDNIIHLRPDGSYNINLEYFDFHKSRFMINNKFCELFGSPRREPESRITKKYMDVAASVQKVTEEIIILIATHLRKITNEDNLVLAGGVALNCVANGKLQKEKIFKNIWVQPAAGDAGGALGCALYMLHKMTATRKVILPDMQSGSFLGPEYRDSDIKSFLDNKGIVYTEMSSMEDVYRLTAGYLAENKVVGWFQGRMEYGPRALGHRSILGNPSDENMQSNINLKIKFRESFRPFAPAVLEEDCNQYFELDVESPYMLLVSNVQQCRCIPFNVSEALKSADEDMINVVNVKKSDIPAVTHVDYSARIQTVDNDRNPEFYNLIKEYKKLTGCSVLVNTSFNVRGEPIVCSPEHAYLCFMRTEMDILVLGRYILKKSEQKPMIDNKDWMMKYELD